MEVITTDNIQRHRLSPALVAVLSLPANTTGLVAPAFRVRRLSLGPAVLWCRLVREAQENGPDESFGLLVGGLGAVEDHEAVGDEGGKAVDGCPHGELGSWPGGGVQSADLDQRIQFGVDDLVGVG